MTVSIFAVAGLAVYTTFNSGMKVWRKAKDLSQKSRGQSLKIEKMKRELRQAFIFRKEEIAFSGTKVKISLAAIIDSKINRLTYAFDPGQEAILRNTEELADILASQEGQGGLGDSPAYGGVAGGMEADAPYISGVKEFSLAYFYLDPQKQAYAWKDDWQEDYLPTAMRLNIGFEDEKYSETVFIPSA